MLMMSTRTNPSPVPPEALARKARLHSLLRAMEMRGPSREPSCLQALRDLDARRAAPDLDARFETILAERLVEEACELLRALRREAADDAGLESLALRLAPLAGKARQQRSARWQLDTQRTLVRFSYAKGEGVLGFDDGDLLAVFLQAFRLEGLRLQLDLGKRPRPLLSAGLPLPAGVGGLSESMDAVLAREPEEGPAALVERLNRRLPQGLRVLQWTVLPGYASPLCDLARRSRWRWEVPPELRTIAEERVAAFLASGSWPWDRGTAFPGGPLDLRQVVAEMDWEGPALRFSTRMKDHAALNPLKLLGAILDVESARLSGLVRVSVELRPDPRLGQAERFQPKLRNMYEDAVLLAGGSNITLVDDDDDEPIRLG
jgi:radical SAM-linked protein